MPITDVVWFKRDLRIRDHTPLKRALQRGTSVLLLHLFEPEDLAHPTTSNRHVVFRTQAWRSISDEVRQAAWPLESAVLRADALSCFHWLNEHHGLQRIWSYEETGLEHTFARDRTLKRWCAETGIDWVEIPQLAVSRGRQNRVGWQERWHHNMAQPLDVPIPGPQLTLPERVQWPDAWQLPELLSVTHAEDPGVVGPFQQGGEGAAHRYLKSFFDGRVKGYRRQIGQPEASRMSCSRLSPYLAWGCLSMRQVFQAYQSADVPKAKMDLKAFGSRLRWQGHFIQKFESECRIEFESVNRGYMNRAYSGDPAHLEAWKRGQTGIPLVDACMRCVVETGYLNFRMRAMLVSFLTHHLDHPWQAGVEHLARCFLDFEPGIHYSQFQMQAGVTGINTIRIYNPVKQGEERDAEGAFVRKWVPELAQVPIEFLHAPWKMPPMERLWNGLDSSLQMPIVDVDAAGRAARERLWSLKRDDQVRNEAQRILAMHVVPSKLE